MGLLGSQQCLDTLPQQNPKVREPNCAGLDFGSCCLHCSTHHAIVNLRCFCWDWSPKAWTSNFDTKTECCTHWPFILSCSHFVTILWSFSILKPVTCHQHQRDVHLSGQASTAVSFGGDSHTTEEPQPGGPWHTLHHPKIIMMFPHASPYRHIFQVFFWASRRAQFRNRQITAEKSEKIWASLWDCLRILPSLPTGQTTTPEPGSAWGEAQELPGNCRHLPTKKLSIAIVSQKRRNTLMKEMKETNW